MQQYKDTVQYVLDNGTMRGDRTGKGRHGVFSPPDEIYDLSKGFPLCTLRAIKPAAMIDELLWFISGSVDSSELKYKFFWDRWTAKEEDVIKYGKDVLGLDVTPDNAYTLLPWEVIARIDTVGHMYGASWRKAAGPKGINHPKRELHQYPPQFVLSHIPVNDSSGDPLFTPEGYIEFLTTDHTDEKANILKEDFLKGLHEEYWSNYDQLNELIVKIKTNPNSSRLRVTAYLTEYMAFEEFSSKENIMDGRAALTPCHTFFQCYVNPVKGGKSKLDLKLTLTSSDVPVGRVYNIAQYALLCEMLAHCCDLDPGRLIISTGDAHIYGDQFDAVETILSREPGPLPKLRLNPEVRDLFSFKADDIKILEYFPQEEVDIPVAV